MIFKEGLIYHIYNQGNNRGRIFFTRENYFFFLRKIRQHILPFSDILAWCLMPNHFHALLIFKFWPHGIRHNNILSWCEHFPWLFHLMVYVNTIDVLIPYNDGVPLSHPVIKKQTLNSSIGIMLRSYTRAVNKQEDRSGALFREETKAICLNEINDVTPNWFESDGITSFNIRQYENEYPQVCFNYIHQNPVKAGLVKTPGEWEFSSLADIIGLRDDKLINHSRIHEFGLFIDVHTPYHT
jgi:putative transposase